MDSQASGSVSARSRGRAATVLSPHERAVLELVTTGHTNVEMAARLRLSNSSIKSCLRTAYRKIDVTTRAEAIRWGVQHGAGC